jgi:NNP family nitrate/nitrite transporter-like MFS transporter
VHIFLQGNMGGGFTHFLMPLVFDGIKASGSPAFLAWRWAFFVPASFQVLLTICTMALTQDMPDGNYAALKKSSAMQKSSAWGTWKAAITNYRTWVMTLTYGYCFGECSWDACSVLLCVMCLPSQC